MDKPVMTAPVRGIDYTCHSCGVPGVKLWRPWGYGNVLKCARCIAPHIVVDAEGMSGCDPEVYPALAKSEHLSRSDQMHDNEHGAMAPAIPSDGTFWCYSTVPWRAVEWWKGLPTYPNGKAFDVAAANAVLEEAEQEHQVVKDRERQEHLTWAEGMIRDTFFVVQASDEEMSNLWSEHSREGFAMTMQQEARHDEYRIFGPKRNASRRFEWQQINRGHCKSLAPLVVNGKEMPHVVTVWWWRINGRLVAFYEATSMAVHHGLVEEWVQQAFGHCQWGFRWAHCNAANFHHCLQAIREAK